MNNIKPTAFAPASVISIQFRIPLYQRPYAWESFQVEQLLKDLFNQFKKDPSQKYYIGILNIGSTEQNNVCDLIDGQQRITTLCLIGSVLKSSFSYWNDFLQNRLDLYGRKEDQLYLEKHECSDKTNQRMIETVRVIDDFIISDVLEEKEMFSKYIYENASFFISKVPDHYSLVDKNLQFVRMNNRGKQLESHDVLKIKLAVNILAEEERNEFIKKWNKFSQLGCSNRADEIKESKTILELLEPNQSKDNFVKDSEIFYQAILSYSEFLLIALARFFKKKNSDIVVSQSKERLDQENKKYKLIEEFGFGEKEIDFSWTEESVLEFSETLEAQFNLFDKYIIKRDKEEKYKFSGDKERFTENFLLELQIFQSFLFVTREPNQSNWLIEAFDYLDSLEIKDDKINTKDFLVQLKKLDNDRCTTRNSKSMVYGIIDRYWFWRLDYYLWENRNKFFPTEQDSHEIANKYVFRINRSIEHIAPQQRKEDSKASITYEKFNHSFGNLVMISSGQNSSLKNNTFEIKKAQVKEHIKNNLNSSIESLKMLMLYKEEDWNDTVLQKHSDDMIDVLIDSFNGEYPEIIENLEKNKYKIDDNAKQN